MLTLITGTPGTGKTAYAVAKLVEEIERKPRPVVVMGIPELQIPHEVAPPVDAWTRKVASAEDAALMEAEFTFPEGALIIIDEAQKVFRPRAAGSKVPDHVAAFEKHRHRGLDFWLITQHPNLLDGNVRRLVGKHIALRAHWAGRELLEWSEASDPESRSARAVAVRQRYRLPKRIFGLYKSASMHVKQRRRVPLALYVFAAVVCISAFLAWRVYGRVSSAISGDVVAEPARSSGGGLRSPGAGAVAQGNAGPGLSLEAFAPRLQGRADSAPIYDPLRQVVAMPSVVGCVATRSRCSCFTEQASDSGLSEAECRAWLRSPPFSPFRAVWPAAVSPSGGQARGQEKGPESSGPVGVLGAS